MKMEKNMGKRLAARRARGTCKARAVKLAVLPQRPQTREELRAWVARYAGLQLPARAVCAGHDTPLDYLAYAFFEEGATADTVVWACRGGGKTTIGAVATLLDMLFKPGIQIKILGGSEDQSRRMYAYLCDMVEREFSGRLKGKMQRRGFALDNGSRVEILTQSQRAVRGTRVQKMRCDEVELFDTEVWSAAQLTTRSLLLEGDETAPAAGAAPGTAAAAGRVVARGAVEVFSTLHRPSGLMTQLVAPSDAPAGAPAAALLGPRGRRVFRWCVWDVIGTCRPQERACEGCQLWKWCGGRARSAVGFLPVEDVLQLHSRASRRLWETEMLCQTPVPEDAVFGSFGAAHLRSYPGGTTCNVDGRTLRHEHLVAGIDYGWKRFVCLWIALLRDDAGRRAAWIVDEYVQGERDLPAHIAAMLARPARAEVYYADIAGLQHDAHSGRTSEAMLRAAGLTVKSRSMAIHVGIERIRLLLEPPEATGSAPTPRLWVDPRCRHTIAALRQYEEKAGEPIKDGVHDHLIDALRYALIGHDGTGGGGKLESRHY